MNKSEIEFANEQSNKMSDLISREALFKCFQKQAMTLYGKNSARYQVVMDIMDGVRFAPTVDAVEVVHGQWDEERFAFCNVCSNCGLVIDRTSIKMHSGKFNFCPNCGAKMDEVGE